MQSKEEAYWEGYIQKQNEAMEICKQCKYIKNSISKKTIEDKIRERQFELQQEFIDFKDDIKLNTLQELLEEK